MSFGPFHGLAIWKEYKNDEIDGNWDIPDPNHFPALCKAALSKGNQFLNKSKIPVTNKLNCWNLVFQLEVGRGSYAIGYENSFVKQVFLHNIGQERTIYSIVLPEDGNKILFTVQTAKQMKLTFKVFKNSLIINYHRSEIIQLYYYYQIL